MEVAVISGGQAGLATGYYLRRAGLVPGEGFVILDAATRPGGAWPRMWDDLRLFSPSSVSSLPGWMMPPWNDAEHGFPPRQHVVDYHYRRPARRATPIDPADAEDLLSVVENSPNEGPTAELARCVTALLERLPENYRHALELTDVRGMTQGRAADQLGLSTSGMKSRVQRGRRLLRDEVASCCQIALDSHGGLADLTPHVAGDERTHPALADLDDVAR